MRFLKIRNNRNAKWSIMKFNYNHEMVTWLLLHDFIPTDESNKKWKHLWGQEEVVIK